MKFQLLGDWPVKGGALLVPAGTLIEWEADAEAARLAGVPTQPQWRGTTLPLPMPLNARAMNQQSYDALVAWYTPHLIDGFLHLLNYAPGIVPKTRQQ